MLRWSLQTNWVQIQNRIRSASPTYMDIAKIIGRNRQTVMAYFHSYEEGGISGLQMKKTTGKPEKLSKEQQKQLADTIVNKTPAEVGFEAKYTWTLQLIADWIQQEFQQSFTPKGVSKMLHRLGFSYTKATYTLAKADPDEQGVQRSHFSSVEKGTGERSH
ncbi:transposase [Heyndrickxia coagulans]|nr:transposase [Heyndrickxia coagulans]